MICLYMFFIEVYKQSPTPTFTPSILKPYLPKVLLLPENASVIWFDPNI